MACEVRFVRAQIAFGDDLFIREQLDDAIDEDERVSMG